MMCKSRVFLKSQITNKLLSWIENTMRGSMGTHARLSWELTPPTNGSLHGLKLQIKVPSGLYSKPLQRVLTTNESSMVSIHPNLFTKTDFNLDESKWILKDLLNSVWNTFSNDRPQFNNNGFLRSVPEIKKIIVEYGSPNIAKPLHMGHLRSTVTGHYVARICKAAGHDVTTICFLGDWGTQFGILQAGLKKWLPTEVNYLRAVDKMELGELLEFYVKAVKEKEADEEFFKEALNCSASLEKRNPDAIKVWKSIREKTVNHLTSFWELFGIHYDLIQGESEFTVQSQYTEKALKLLTELKAIEIGEDKRTYSILPPDKKFSFSVKVPLVKSDGSSLYLLRDIACCLARLDKFSFNHMLYVVDKSQAHHFLALFRLLEMLKIQKNMYHEDEWERKLRHVTFGKVSGMSTRSGNFVLLSDVIKYGASLMEENRVKSPNARNVGDSSIATKLAISALVVNSLKTRRNRDVNFDWKIALRPTGETGVNLQYTHARLYSLETKLWANFSKSSLMNGIESAEFDIDYLINDPVALDLAIHLINFEDAFWSSYSELEPCILLTHLFKLSDKVSKSMKMLNVQNEQNHRIAATRFMLFCLSKRVLSQGMYIIGLEPLDEI